VCFLTDGTDIGAEIIRQGLAAGLPSFQRLEVPDA
jgi:hypothetical protein